MAIADIPQELVDRDQWIVWREETRDGRSTKVPYANGIMAATDTPTTWLTFGAAAEQMPGHTGLGYVFSSDDPYFGIDLDSCLHPDGSVTAWAEEVLSLCPTYTEISPGGCGLKLIGRGRAPLPDGKTGKTYRDGLIAVSDDKAPEIAIWNQRRFFCMTGECYDGRYKINDCHEGIAKLYQRLFGKRRKPAQKTNGHGNYEKCLAAMKAMAMTDHNDGSRRLYAACCRAVAHDLSESQAIACVREYHQAQPFPTQWSDDAIRRRLKDAESEVTRGEALQTYGWKKQQDGDLVLVDAARDYANYVQGKGHTDDLIATGIPELDDAVGGGLENGECVVVAGRPGHGKSALALQMIHEMTYCGLPALYVNEEMSSRQMGKRCIQFVSPIGIDGWGYNHDLITRHIDDYGSVRSPCYLEIGCATVDNVAAAIRHYVGEHGIKVAVIDYLQRLNGPGRGKYEVVTEASKTISSLSNELNILVIMLCQLNRVIEGRQGYIPSLSDLRDSGQIEQDADVVIFGVWPWRMHPDYTPQDEYMLSIAKNRNRETKQSSLVVTFDGPRQMVRAKDLHGMDNYTDDFERYK